MIYLYYNRTFAMDYGAGLRWFTNVFTMSRRTRN